MNHYVLTITDRRGTEKKIISSVDVQALGYYDGFSKKTKTKEISCKGFATLKDAMDFIAEVE